MRRSVAPSQVNSAAKKPRFSTPFLCKNPLVKPTEKPLSSAPIDVTPIETRTTSDILKLIQGSELILETGQSGSSDIKHSQILKTAPTNKINNSRPQLSPTKAYISIENPQTSDCHYYNVVWCKISTRKHKKWEGDAILIIQGRTATLKDMEGKQIAQAFGYKLKEVENLDDGSTLKIGGKEVEIMNAIKDCDFKSGACFLNTSEQTPIPVIKTFRPKTKLALSRRPLYDSSNPNAFVLTPPSQNHQWTYNVKKLPVTDVVIDPHLVLHMRPHQKEGILFLYECVMGMRDYNGFGAILADEMGLGKTLQCIVLIWTLLKQGPYGAQPVLKKVLIVTPSSLVQNWVKEFNKWLSKGRIVLYAVDSRHPVKDFAKTPCCPVMIISYEMLMRSCDKVEKMNFDLMICDEGHRLKNSSVKTTSVITRLPIKRRILLTGTPVQNDLQEFFALVEFCNPGILGSSASFHRIYEDPIVKSRQPTASEEEKDLGTKRAEKLSRLTALFTLRRTQEIINKYLPPKVENVVFCKPSALQVSLTKIVLNSTAMRNCLQNPESAHPFICITALKKICNHPGLLLKKKKMDDPLNIKVDLYDDLTQNLPPNLKDNISNEELSGKIKVLSLLLSSSYHNDNKERFVLVSGFTKTLDLFEHLCHKNDYLFLRLDGSTPTAQRQTIVDKFNQNESFFLFLLSSKAGGVGFNLIGASRIILFDIDWNPANDLQAMARVWRDGQRKTVHIYRFLTTGSIEEKIFQRQISKQNLSEAVMEQFNSAKSQFTKEDLKDLFTLHENTNSITHDKLNCTCLDSIYKIEENDNCISIDRPCQLAVNRGPKLKENLNMTELMHWRHFNCPITEDVQDKHLEAASDNISFLFQTKANNLGEGNKSTMNF